MYIFLKLNKKNIIIVMIIMIRTTTAIIIIIIIIIAKRPCGAPWLSKSTHARKFGKHVTVHRPPARPSVRTTGKPMFNLSLSS